MIADRLRTGIAAGAGLGPTLTAAEYAQIQAQLTPVLRKNSRRDRLKSILVMETAKNRTRGDTMRAGKLVTG